MKPPALLLGCLLATASLAQTTPTRREVWVWKDANDVTHYSDAPAPGARKIVITGSTTTAAPAASPSQDSTRANTQPVNDVNYLRLEITSPQNEASFFGADAVVDVRVRMEPDLGPNDRLVTYLDGKPLGGESALEHSLSSIERGGHSLLSEVLDARGRVKVRSAPVVFYIKPPSNAVNPRALGPKVRPPQPKGS